MTTLTAQRTRIDVLQRFKFRHLWLYFLDASSHSRYMIELTVITGAAVVTLVITPIVVVLAFVVVSAAVR